MKIDLYRRPFEATSDNLDMQNQAQIYTDSFLAIPSGSKIPNGIPGFPDLWRLYVVQSDLEHHNSLELLGISDDTLLEEFEDKGYAISTPVGQIREAPSLMES